MSISQNGFSLMEVLITIIILSVGMLGIAALYVESLKSGHTALSRTKAINLAADMADRIRANRAGQARYVATTAPAGTTAPVNCASSALGTATDCNEIQMANYDIWSWKTSLGNSSNSEARRIGLANATASIVQNTATSPVSFTIEINWSDKDQDQNYTLTFAL